MKPITSIKHCILAYLYQQPSWVWAGKLARDIGQEQKTKESVVERRARELCEAGLIDREYAQVEGEGPRCVRYKLHEETKEIKEPTVPTQTGLGLAE